MWSTVVGGVSGDMTVHIDDTWCPHDGYVKPTVPVAAQLLMNSHLALVIGRITTSLLLGGQGLYSHTTAMHSEQCIIEYDIADPAPPGLRYL